MATSHIPVYLSFTRYVRRTGPFTELALVRPQDLPDKGISHNSGRLGLLHEGKVMSSLALFKKHIAILN